jgi:hypothetical protein
MKFDLTTEFSELIKRCSPVLLIKDNPVEIAYGGIDLATYEKVNDEALTKAIGEGANVNLRLPAVERGGAQGKGEVREGCITKTQA